VATSSVAPALVINSTDLPPVPPSAIVPQRANLKRTMANRPPRLPRAESVTREKKASSPIQERSFEEETIVTDETRLTSKRRIRTKEHKIELDDVQVVVEQELVRIQLVQTTPLRGRKKKALVDDAHQIPLLEPPALLVEQDIPVKTLRTGRNKKKQESELVEVTHQQHTRTSSLRQRKKHDDNNEIIVIEQVTGILPKKVTRNRKKTEPLPDEVNQYCCFFSFLNIIVNDMVDKHVLFLFHLECS
jgi:hypothetical protein